MQLCNIWNQYSCAGYLWYQGAWRLQAGGVQGWASCCFGPGGPCVPDFKIDLIANSWQS